MKIPLMIANNMRLVILIKNKFLVVIIDGQQLYYWRSPMHLCLLLPMAILLVILLGINENFSSHRQKAINMMVSDFDRD